jgi:MFS family permease
MLNTILPFITIGTKLVFCSLADRYQVHRLFFVIFLTTALIGYGSFAVLPFFITKPAESEGLKHGTFALICCMTSVGTISMSVISCLSDAFAINSAKRYRTSYGMIRLWGTIGWGVAALTLSVINETDTLPFLVPGLILTIVLLLTDIMAAIFWRVEDDFKLERNVSDIGIDALESVVTSDSESISKNDSAGNKQNGSYGTTQVSTTTNDNRHIDITSVHMQWILFKQVASRRKSIFHYMVLFTISGSLITLQWSYFFLYIEKIFTKDFSYISGLSMFSSSMLGELPFFLFSQYIIKSLGRSHTLSVSIASIGLRYLLYEYMLPKFMYTILLTEIFQGPNFALFYVVMTEVALDYSNCDDAISSIVDAGIVPNDPAQIQKLQVQLKATMQSIMGSCYEGLGVGLGSLLGGFFIDYYGYDSLWFYASFTAISLGLTNLIIDLSGLGHT